MGTKHDLVQLIEQATSEMAAEYRRIRMRTREDPGTAGDQGEENWAALLRNWLPSSFKVKTKGRIIFSNGSTSNQMDVLILSPSYPNGLLDKKLYLAAGVLAAFECKNTLRSPHLRKSAQSSSKLGQLSRADRSIIKPIIYGVLAHSCEIKSKGKTIQEAVTAALIDADQKEITDYRDCLDFVCISDLATWTHSRLPIETEKDLIYGVATMYSGPLEQWEKEYSTPPGEEDDPIPIGRFLAGLIRRLGMVEPALAPIATYFRDTGLSGASSGTIREWIIHDPIQDRTKYTFFG